MILLRPHLLGTKFLCYMSLIFVAYLEFINICKDIFVCYLWIGKVNVHNLLVCLLNQIFWQGLLIFISILLVLQYILP